MNADLVQMTPIKSCPYTHHDRIIQVADIQFHPLTSALHGRSGMLHAPAVLSREKEPSVLNEYGLGGPHSRSRSLAPYATSAPDHTILTLYA